MTTRPRSREQATSSSPARRAPTPLPSPSRRPHGAAFASQDRSRWPPVAIALADAPGLGELAVAFGRIYGSRLPADLSTWGPGRAARLSEHERTRR
jgi:hypothetical protein